MPTVSQEEIQDIVGAMITGNTETGIAVTYADDLRKLNFVVTAIDEKVAVDSGAIPGYLGAAANDGVLRADGSIGYADGGDFITLSVNEAGVDHDALANRLHDGDVIEPGGIDSDDGPFPFDTTGTVTFNQGVAIVGHAAIGATAAVSALDLLQISETYAGHTAASNVDGVSLAMVASPGAASAAIYRGSSTLLTTAGANGTTGSLVGHQLFVFNNAGGAIDYSNIFGVDSTAYVGGLLAETDNTADNLVALRGTATANSSNAGVVATDLCAVRARAGQFGKGTVTNMHGVCSQITISDAGGAITNAYVMKATYVHGLGTTTNAYGLYVDKLTGAGTNTGILLAGDGIGADIAFGAGNDARMYWDGFDLKIDSGGGVTSIVGACEALQGIDVNDDDVDSIKRLIFAQGTGANEVIFPDNLPEALVFAEGANDYQTFISTNGHEAVRFAYEVQGADFIKTGWPQSPDVTLSFDNANKRVTVTDGGTGAYYVDGVKYVLGGNKTVDITDTEGQWYIYFVGSTLTASQTVWDFTAEDKALVAFLYWDATNKEEITFGYELHGYGMSGATHGRLHFGGGSAWDTGLLVSDAGAEDVNVEAGVILDEDLTIAITDGAGGGLFEQVLSPGELPIYYRDGATAWRIYDVADKANATDAGYVDGANDLKYNKLNGVWANATVGLNNYVAYFVIATNDQTEPVALIMGQRVDNKLSDAKTNNIFAGLDLTGLPFEEMVILARLILKDTNAGVFYTLEDIVDLRSFNAEGNVTSPLITAHAGLSGLPWSESGHSIDTDFLPDTDNAWDLGATTTGRWKDLYLAGNITDDVNTVTVANLKVAYDHSQDNSQAHSDYLVNNANDVTTGSLTMDDLLLYDTDASHTLLLHWNEDEAGANRTLNLLVSGGDRTFTLSGNLTVEGASLIDQDLTQDSATAVLAQLEITGDLDLGGNALVAGHVALEDGNEIRFYDAGDSDYVGFEAPALTGTQIWILPDADGGASEFLQTDGAGTLTWAAAAAVGHTHDGDTLQLDAVNSDGGAFAFTTTGPVTFNQEVEADRLGAGPTGYSPTVLVNAGDTTLETTTDYHAFGGVLTKTGGVTDTNDDIGGIIVQAGINQAGGIIGYLHGSESTSVMGDGTVTLDLIGDETTAYVTGGDVDGDVIGRKTTVDIESGMGTMGGNTFGHLIVVDDNEGGAHTTYMIYMDEVAGVDYGIWQNGTSLNYFGGSVQIGNGGNLVLQEVIDFAGATGENQIRFNDNLADALSVVNDNGDVFQKFISTTGSLENYFGQKVTINGTLGCGAITSTGNIAASAAGGVSISAISTGDNVGGLLLSGDRTAADRAVGTITGNWGANRVAYIAFVSGGDAVNKDDGKIEFWTSDNASTIAKRMTIEQDGSFDFASGNFVGVGTIASGTITISSGATASVAGGHLYLRATGTSGRVYVEGANSVDAMTQMIQCRPDTYVAVKYAGATKLQTTNTGVDVTGHVTDDSCAIFEDEDCLAWIRDMTKRGSGIMRDFGGVQREVFDLDRLQSKYPEVMHKIRILDPEDEEKEIEVVKEAIGVKSDICYRAIIQLDDRVKQLEVNQERSA